MGDGELERVETVPITGEARDDGPIIVVTAIHLSARARAALAEKLGPGHIVRDIRDAGNTADIVLVPAMSGTGVGELRQMFPGAKLLAGEFVDDQYGVDVVGPLRRALDIEVDGYFLAPDLAAVAQVTRDTVLGKPVGVLDAAASAMTPRRSLEAGATATGRGTLHVVDPHDVRSAAAQLGAVAIDSTEWSDRLGLTTAAQQRELTDLLSALTRDLLDRGVDVVCASVTDTERPAGSA